MSKSIQHNLASNIWKYAIFLIVNKRIFAAILGAYYVSVPGVGAKQVGVILLASSIAGFLLEIPSGYLSDKLGHKNALVFSRICVFISTLFFLFANNIHLLILGGIFLSVGNAFLSGTGSAFMHETLTGLNREKDYATVMGKIRSLGFAIPVVFMVFTPFLVSVSFKLPFLIGLIFDIIGLAVAISFVVPKVTQKQIDEINTKKFVDVLKEGKKLQFIRIVVFTGILAGIAGVVGRYRAVYWSFLDIPVIYYGVFLGIGRVLVSVLLFYSGKLKKILSYNMYLALRGVLFFALIMSMGFITNPWIIVGVFVTMNVITFGFGTLNNSYVLDIIGKSKFKATLLSLKPQIELLVVGVGSLLFGISVDMFGYQTSFVLSALLLATTLTPFYFYIRRRKIN